MKVSRRDVTSYLPHRPPFLLVDNLLEASGEQFKSDFFLDPEHVLVENGKFTEAGLLENIAQTCALGFGYLDSAADGQPKMGFIGAISRVEITWFPGTNQTIETDVSVLHTLGNIFLVRGVIFCEGSKVLESEMKIVVS